MKQCFTFVPSLPSIDIYSTTRSASHCTGSQDIFVGHKHTVWLSLFHLLTSPWLFFHYKLRFCFRWPLLSLAWSLAVLVPRLSCPLQLLGPRVQAEQSGDLTQDGVVLLEAGDPLVEGGLVSLAGHAHGKDWTLLHWTEDTQELYALSMRFSILFTLLSTDWTLCVHWTITWALKTHLRPRSHYSP